jgi:hypothetical protein
MKGMTHGTHSTIGWELSWTGVGWRWRVRGARPWRRRGFFFDDYENRQSCFE